MNNDLTRTTISLINASRSTDFDEAYSRMHGKLTSLIMDRQRTIGRLFYQTEPLIMRSLSGWDQMRDPEADFDPDDLQGWAGNGQTIIDNLHTAIVHGKQAISGGQTVSQAWQLIADQLVQRATTIVSDTARTSSLMAARTRVYHAAYVRVLTPPSCGRCAVLAGQPSGRDPFLRHPNCDCTAAWADNEAALATHYANADDYLDSLSDKDLAHVLGSQANARAYKDGADLGQLVNAYDHAGAVQTSQTISHGTLKYTSAGTTKRGYAYMRMKQAGLVKQHTRNGGTYWRAEAPRLMPETIYKLAGNNHDLAMRMLRNYGWI